jgi:hypothetical protein
MKDHNSDQPQRHSLFGTDSEPSAPKSDKAASGDETRHGLFGSGDSPNETRGTGTGRPPAAPPLQQGQRSNSAGRALAVIGAIAFVVLVAAFNRSSHHDEPITPDDPPVTSAPPVVTAQPVDPTAPAQPAPPPAPPLSFADANPDVVTREKAIVSFLEEQDSSLIAKGDDVYAAFSPSTAGDMKRFSRKVSDTLGGMDVDGVPTEFLSAMSRTKDAWVSLSEDEDANLEEMSHAAFDIANGVFQGYKNGGAAADENGDDDDTRHRREAGEEATNGGAETIKHTLSSSELKQKLADDVTAIHDGLDSLHSVCRTQGVDPD